MSGAGAIRILVVDDDPAMVRAVCRVLDRRYDLLPARAPGEALELASRHRPDLAIVDVRMPEMDGFELTKELLRVQPDLDVIIMTGNAAEPEAHLVRAIEEGAFYFIQKPFDRRVLLTLVARCLELRRLQNERQQHLDRLERDLAEARRFQRSLLPPAERTIEGVELRARYHACDALGGDLYDYAATDDGAIAFMVADVSGHGASAAMLTGIVKSAFHAAGTDGFAPSRVVHRVTEAIQAFDPRRFVTLVCGRLDPRSGALEYANAGHPPPMLRSSGAPPAQLDSTGPLISAGVSGIPCEVASATMDPGALLLVYSDGVIEARGANGMFGCDRVRALVESSSDRGGPLLDEIESSLGAFVDQRPFLDDVTLLAVGR